MTRAITYLKNLRYPHLRKAIYGGTGAAGVVLGKALLDLHISHAELGLIASAGVGAAVVTFFAPANDPTELTAVDPAPPGLD